MANPGAFMKSRVPSPATILTHSGVVSTTARNCSLASISAFLRSVMSISRLMPPIIRPSASRTTAGQGENQKRVPSGHTFNAIGSFDALQGDSHWTLVVRQVGAVRKEDLPCYAPLISADLWRPPRKLHRCLIEIRQPTLGVRRVNSDRQ